MELQRSFVDEMAALNEEFGTDFAIISHIDGARYEVVEVASELDTIKAGAVFETHDTYCNAVLEKNQVVTYDHIGKIKAMVLHPIYTAMQLEAYIGLPLHWEGRIVGTLNFSGFDPKRPGFESSDIHKAEKLAKDIEAAITAA